MQSNRIDRVRNNLYGTNYTVYVFNWKLTHFTAMVIIIIYAKIPSESEAQT